MPCVFVYRSHRCPSATTVTLQIMKITHFQDTDTLYLEFRTSEVAATCERDENTLLDIDAHGHLCRATFPRELSISI